MERSALNDCHSTLNLTAVASIARPDSHDELIDLVRDAKRHGRPLIPFGGKHAMGGQQFGTGAIALDTRGLDRFISLDVETGIVEVEAGIAWPALVDTLNAPESKRGVPAAPLGWTIAQKQTGADRMTLGGSLSSNIHGRCLNKGPLIEDVVSLEIVDANGCLVRANREENPELFRLAIGGYGLFGVIYSVRLQLVPRKRMRRSVKVMEIDSLPSSFAERVAQGYAYGDFQFAIDDQSDDFMKTGIFSCYQEVDPTEEDSPAPSLREKDWLDLLYLAHTDKTRGFEKYRDHYLHTDGSLHWSDRHQFTTYVDGYHSILDQKMGSPCRGSEMITELYVPPEKLCAFMEAARSVLRTHVASLIYGTVRRSRRDPESFLAWAKEDSVCVIFNLCVQHSPSGLEKAKATFQALIDTALGLGGSFYLTYHRFARRDQIEAAYPQFSEFLHAKEAHDPSRLFQSDWWRHHRSLFRDA